MLWNCDPNDGEGTLELIEELTRNAGEVQRLVLEEILEGNRETEYLHGFMEGSADVGRFKEKVPIVEYEQVKPYIDRIGNGAPSSIICAKPITELLTSSGTSGGKPKMMPSTEEDLDRKTFMYNLLEAVMNKHVEGLDKGKAMYLLFVKPEITTPSGLKAHPVLTSYYKSPHFRRCRRLSLYTSPDAAILCPDSAQSMYCQLLCGLLHRRSVLRVGAVFASAFLRAIKFLEAHWPSLCHDIRTGRLSDVRVTHRGCRDVVAAVLAGPDPEAAGEIEGICAEGTWEGIVRRLWPATKYVDVIVTGSMAQYVPTLEFYTGGLPLLSTMYASSESYFGINMEPLREPGEVAYTLVPNMAYFEFMRVDEGGRGELQGGCGGGGGGCNGHCGGGGGGGGVEEEEEEEEEEERGESVGEVVDLVDVEVGRYYELVVTTFTGLYRYRVGDILTVSGFHNATPQFRFVHRRNVVLSVDTDKTNEDDLLRAITAAKPLLRPLHVLLTEYTSYADTSSFPGHYVLFWELTPTSHHHPQSPLDPAVITACCEALEGALDSVYRMCRSRDRSVGALEIRVVPPGAFDALMDLCVARGSSVNQYKTPRCIKSKEAIELLDARVVGRFFSQRVPKWQPSDIGDHGGVSGGDGTTNAANGGGVGGTAV